MNAPRTLVESFDSVPLWLSARQAHQGAPHFAVGASDVPAILGRSSFRGPWDVWTDHHGPAHDDLADEDDVRTRGHLIEPVLVEHYRQATGRDIDASLLVVSDPLHPWRRVSTDAIIQGERVVECKTFSFQARGEWSSSDVLEPVPVRDAVLQGLIPEGYSLQCIYQAAVADVPVVDLVAAQCSTRRLRAVTSSGSVLEPVWVLESDPVVVSVFVPAETRAWMLDTITAWRERHLVGGEAPDPDGSAAQVRAYAHRMLPGHFPATAEIRQAAADLARARAATKASKADEKAAKGRVLALLGEQTVAFEPDQPKTFVARARQTKRALMVDAVDTLS